MTGKGTTLAQSHSEQLTMDNSERVSGGHGGHVCTIVACSSLNISFWSAGECRQSEAGAPTAERIALVITHN